MTESVEAIVAEMRLAHSVTMRQLADRLQSAHDAEVHDLEAKWANCSRCCAKLQDRAESAESRLREAERDASELRAAVAKTYAMIPGLPIEAATMDAATDALHDLCLTVGLFDIPVDGVDRAMEGEDG